MILLAPHSLELRAASSCCRWELPLGHSGLLPSQCLLGGCAQAPVPVGLCPVLCLVWGALSRVPHTVLIALEGQPGPPALTVAHRALASLSDVASAELPLALLCSYLVAAGVLELRTPPPSAWIASVFNDSLDL